LWSAFSEVRTQPPSGLLYLIAFSMMLVKASAIFVWSISALTGRKLSKKQLHVLPLREGVETLLMISVRQHFVDIDRLDVQILRLPVHLHEGQQVRDNLILPVDFLRDVLHEIADTARPARPAWQFSASARTFMEASGVFSSWETLATNSSRESSIVRIRRIIRLKAFVIISVSR
jgi:hypothetical protein